MSLGLHSVGRETLGYGELGIAVAAAFPDHVPITPPDVPKTGTALWVTVPPCVSGKWDGQHLALLTMWESTVIPEAFVDTIRQVDTLLVPNRYNFKQFSALHPNVHTVPLGIDPAVWSPVDRVVEDEFRFLACGSGARKGLDATTEAFRRAFPDADSLEVTPKLVLKDPKYRHVGDHIIHIDSRLPLKEFVDLYHSCHVYVGLSRGEGWGYFPHQALSTGMVTILTDHPGHREYWWLPGALPVRSTLGPAAPFMYGDAGEWWEPDIDHAAELMRSAYDDYTKLSEWASDAPALVARDLSIEAMGRVIRAALPPDREYAGSGTWQEPVPLLYDSKVVAPVDAQIGDVVYKLAPGMHQLSSDVRRVLIESGKVAV